ncbi:MAG: DNA-directed RNA polymerase subunit delta [Firmicutes bacterium]|nr:DNA-directed RNA polymerase subunit delta [Bacillota bacterium]
MPDETNGPALDPKAPAVEVAYQILRNAGEPLDYRELIDKVVEVKQIVSYDLAKVMARIYTEINLDPRFTYAGAGAWGLKEWAPKPQGARHAGSQVIPQRSRQPERWTQEEGSGDESDVVRRADEEDNDWTAESD